MPRFGQVSLCNQSLKTARKCQKIRKITKKLTLFKLELRHKNLIEAEHNSVLELAELQQQYSGQKYVIFETV